MEQRGPLPVNVPVGKAFGSQKNQRRGGGQCL